MKWFLALSALVVIGGIGLASNAYAASGCCVPQAACCTSAATCCR
jgi:hypothetical protein